MKILSVRHFLWWAAHPRRWLEAGKRMLAARQGHSWCSEVAVRGSEALEALGFPARIERLRDRHSEELRTATIRQENCPHRMGGFGNIDLIFTLCEYLEAKKTNAIEK